jgi:hypothetical protein
VNRRTGAIEGAHQRPNRDFSSPFHTCPSYDIENLDAREIVVREIPRFAAEKKGLSHRDNFAGWVPIVRQVRSLAQRGRVLSKMSVKIRVAGAEIDHEASSLQEVACQEN